jgi:hypothetical protein
MGLGLKKPDDVPGAVSLLHVMISRVFNKTNDRIRHGLPSALVYSWHSVECCLDMTLELSLVSWPCPR